MGVNAESDILKALNDHLIGMAGVWPISFANVDFVPPANGKYLRVSFQPNETETRFLRAGSYYFKGIYQVMAVTNLGVGEFQAMAQASLVARRFEYLTEIASPSGALRIYAKPSVRPGLKSGASYEVPVTIRYNITTD